MVWTLTQWERRVEELECECEGLAQELEKTQQEVSDLNNELEQFQPVDDWISVKARLPDALTEVLALTADGVFLLAKYSYSTDWEHTWNNKRIEWHVVTHWQPLPEGPIGN